MGVCIAASLLAGCGGGGAPSSTAPVTDSSSSAGAASDTAGDSNDASASLDSLPAEIGEGITVAATPEMYASTDLSKSYTVNMYLIGDTPNDWDKVLGLVNDYLKPFNTELAVTFMSWSDYQTMYPKFRIEL